MTDVEELANTLLAIGHALDELGAEWALGGSLASAAYGEPRATNDIDVIAVLDPAGAKAFSRALTGTFHADEDAAASAARDGGSFNVIDERSFIKVDIFLPRPGPMGRGQLDRRRRLAILPNVEVPVLGPEDVVLQKLRWYRIGGETSERQWRDILSVLRSSALDDAYLDEVSAGAHLDDLSRRARSEAGD